jgi:acetyl esterase/lipase
LRGDAVAVDGHGDVRRLASLQRAVRPDVLRAPNQLVPALYCPGADRRHPWLSPLFGDWHGLPPLLFHAGSTEMLLDDSIRAHDRARAAGVDAEIKDQHSLPPCSRSSSGFRGDGGLREVRLLLRHRARVDASAADTIASNPHPARWVPPHSQGAVHDGSELLGRARRRRAGSPTAVSALSRGLRSDSMTALDRANADADVRSC